MNLLSLTCEGLQIVPLGKLSPKGFISVTIYHLQNMEFHAAVETTSYSEVHYSTSGNDEIRYSTSLFSRGKGC